MVLRKITTCIEKSPTKQMFDKTEKLSTENLNFKL